CARAAPEGVPGPQPGRGVGEVQGRFSCSPRRNPGAHYRAHLACKTVQLGIETFVRRGSGGSRQGSAMPVGLDQKGYPELQQGDQRSGVSLMPGVDKLRGIVLVLGALALFALPVAAGRAQTAMSSGDIIEKLAVEAESDIDL